MIKTQCNGRSCHETRSSHSVVADPAMRIDQNTNAIGSKHVWPLIGYVSGSLWNCVYMNTFTITAVQEEGGARGENMAV
jgi:hypothetical protein